MVHGITWVHRETFFERLPARGGLPSAFFDNSRNLASSSCGLRPEITRNATVPERETRREPQNSSTSVPRFQSGGLNHTGETHSHGGMMDYPRFPISEMYLGKFPGSMACECWKVNFKTEVCSKSAVPHITMHRVKEVEIAKSIDDLMTSQSITGPRDSPRYDMLDAMIASAFEKTSRQACSLPKKKKVSVEEQRAQKDDLFLRGRQITFMICEHFPSTGAYEAVQGLSDLFNARLQNDDGSGFRYKMGSSSVLVASEIPTEMVLEGAFKSKLQDSVQLQTLLSVYEQKNIRNSEQPSYSRLKTSVKLHIDQTLRTRNFRARNEIVERGAVTKSLKKKESLRGAESGRMLSVESNWTVFKKRLM